MNKLHLLFTTILLSGTILLSAQNDSTAYNRGVESITLSAVQGQLDFLASDWTEGRGTGMRGEYIASDYIASMFAVYGLEPGGDKKWHYPSWGDRQNGAEAYQYGTYFQEITMIKYKMGEEQTFVLNSGNESIKFNYLTDFSLSTRGMAKEVASPLVFVGYGFVNEDEKYDDYKGLDVEGKIIVRLDGYPGQYDTTSEAYKKFHPEGRYARYYLGQSKDKVAAEKGVAAIIDISPGYDRSSRWTVNTPFRYKKDYYEGEEELNTIYDYSLMVPGDSLKASPIRISLSKRAAHELFRNTDIDIEQWEKQVKEKMKPNSMVLKGKSALVSSNVESELIKARNVIGVIPGKDTTEAIVIGGHYDHLGMFDGYIWNGADDNASGTVGVMTIAKACMATGEKPERTIVFAAWTGEEKGLIGSRYFVEHPYLPIEDIKFHLNYDMISRDSEDDSLGVECRMSYTAGNQFMEDNTIAFVKQYDLNLEITMRPTMSKGGGSDHSSFAGKDIPFFYFMAGWHDEYHTPMDEIELVNYKKMADIIRIGFLNVWTIANMEEL